MMSMRFSKKRPGVVLLMSLILMAAITAGTIAVAVLLVRTYRQTNSLDNFISAGLGADTGIEQGLAMIKMSRTTSTFDQTITDFASQAATTTLSGSQVKYRVTAMAQATAIPTSLAKDQAFSFDILAIPPASTPPSRLTVRSDACSGGSCGTMRVTWTMVTSSGKNYAGFFNLSTNGLPTTIDLTNVYSDSSNTPSSQALSTVIAYRVQIQAINAAVSNIVAQPCTWNTSTCTASSQGTIQINSTGSLQNTQALKTANVLWQLPSSGIFNFVLFTEGSIVPPS